MSGNGCHWRLARQCESLAAYLTFIDGRCSRVRSADRCECRAGSPRATGNVACPGEPAERGGSCRSAWPVLFLVRVSHGGSDDTARVEHDAWDDQHDITKDSDKKPEQRVERLSLVKLSGARNEETEQQGRHRLPLFDPGSACVAQIAVEELAAVFAFRRPRDDGFFAVRTRCPVWCRPDSCESGHPRLQITNRRASLLNSDDEVSCR